MNKYLFRLFCAHSELRAIAENVNVKKYSIQIEVGLDWVLSLFLLPFRLRIKLNGARNSYQYNLNFYFQKDNTQQTIMIYIDYGNAVSIRL